jgi:hypothetical protein
MIVKGTGIFITEEEQKEALRILKEEGWKVFDKHIYLLARKYRLPGLNNHLEIGTREIMKIENIMEQA